MSDTKLLDLLVSQKLIKQDISNIEVNLGHVNSNIRALEKQRSELDDRLWLKNEDLKKVEAELTTITDEHASKIADTQVIDSLI